MALVQRIPLFQRVSPLSLPEIANLLQHTIATAGTVLLTQGEPGDAMYLIEEGACLVEHTSIVITLTRINTTGDINDLCFEHRHTQ